MNSEPTPPELVTTILAEAIGPADSAEAGCPVAKRNTEDPGDGMRREAPATTAGTPIGMTEGFEAPSAFLSSGGMTYGDVTICGPEYATGWPTTFAPESRGIPQAAAVSWIEGASLDVSAGAASSVGGSSGADDSAGSSSAAGLRMWVPLRPRLFLLVRVQGSDGLWGILVRGTCG